MRPATWAELSPDTAMVRALDRADLPVSRQDALSARRAVRNNWSNRFADACAVMVASEVRENSAFRQLVVRPEEQGTAEPLTFIAGGRHKKVDVVVSSIVSGLQVGFSLKGMNFRDAKGLQFDKNLTGRTYELQDEVSVVHRYQPAAFLVALYFMPLAATADKRSESSPSSFARTVAHLRARTGRIDPTLPSQLDRADMAAVGLYVPGDVESVAGHSFCDDLPRGIVRYFDVTSDPPRRGRPKLDTTHTLRELVEQVATKFSPPEETIAWSEPEA